MGVGEVDEEFEPERVGWPRRVRVLVPVAAAPGLLLTSTEPPPTMPTVVPTLEQIEDYLESLEELIFSSLSAATPDMPRVSEAIQRLWEDVLRFGPQSLPSLNDIHLPGLGTFEVPPPPPPPPPPKTLWEKSADWVAEHPWRTAGIGIGIVGAGLLVGYGSIQWRNSVKARKLRATSSTDRKQVISTPF